MESKLRFAFRYQTFCPRVLVIQSRSKLVPVKCLSFFQQIPSNPTPSTKSKISVYSNIAFALVVREKIYWHFIISRIYDIDNDGFVSNGELFQVGSLQILTDLILDDDSISRSHLRGLLRFFP